MEQCVDTPMPKLSNEPRKLPYLPNELRIRIISFIADPEFLWTTCRFISPEFKQWAEEQYAREHLPRLKFAIDITPLQRKQIRPTNADGQLYPHDKTEFLFNFASFKVSDTSVAILRADGPPWTRYIMQDRPRYWRSEDAYDFLQEDGYASFYQIMSEMDLGLRMAGKAHVCPCRSLRDQTKRGFCKRYEGVGRFVEWKAEERVLEVRWRLLLAFVYATPCPVVRHWRDDAWRG
ncbi:hypothetical protein BU24DRAFT_425776 [Aaosphaeria arxii CBS 175.79]|uniref:F-box domain-containing protein n=1 Tax=Aaosphaeria arxii CBS 175.79 TaxID=1450172 RepID=A0A6A5XGG3_9PLEO|nr:uncharacterized protein BU24DRAFT_425776 [Aaosphaeria arxii CBS 175.79]KAF2011949.1 hypothetical protein BU24DRAFT_425776 [Aaosphaeria arxii CBS 175.79]